MLSTFFHRRRFIGMTQLRSSSQISIFDAPTDIITHRPALAERFPFHLDAFLYQNPVNPQEASMTHQVFCDAIHKASGARVWTVRDVLHELPIARLRDFVIEQSDCKFRIMPSTATDRELMRRDYFDRSLSGLSKDHLIDLLMLHPSVTINVDMSGTGFSLTEIPIAPLSNLVFTRDQQIVSSEGVTLGRFSTPQRSAETAIMRIVWEQLGVPPVDLLDVPCALEGGDFFPLREDVALLGVGLRTNMDAVRALLRADVIGANKIVVVEDVRDFNQKRSHLDTFFSPIDDKVCMCLGTIADDDERYRRMAHVWVKDEAGYVETVTLPFGCWLQKEGYEVVKTTIEQQENYFMSNLTLGRDSTGSMRLFATNPGVEGLLRKHGFDGKVFATDFSAIKSMAGGVHSATQVLRRAV
jgi:arginine deiminase